MRLFHATTRQNLLSIQRDGLRVACADPQAKIKGVWACSASSRGWAILHTQRKHHATLEEVVVIEVHIPKRQLTRFKKGFYYSKTDVVPARIGVVTPATMFGQSLV